MTSKLGPNHVTFQQAEQKAKLKNRAATTVAHKQLTGREVTKRKSGSE